MGAKSEALAKQFETRADQAATLVDNLSDAEWRTTTGSEKWTVGVTAHHVASSLELVADIVSGIVAGQSARHFTTKMLDEMNAAHAKEADRYTRVETVALLRRGAAKAASVVRGLSDEQLATSGPVFADAPPMTAEQLITMALINHVDEHVGSIRRTIGR